MIRNLENVSSAGENQKETPLAGTGNACRIVEAAKAEEGIPESFREGEEDPANNARNSARE